MEPVVEEDVPAAILWADIQSPQFKEHHEILKEFARKGRITYRLRHRPAITREDRRVMLSGYGVELALKKTDYIVMDDRDVQSSTGENSENPAGDTSKAPITELDDQEIQDIAPVHPKDLPFLGTRAASFVMNSEDPFNTLLKLLQDFPKHSGRVAAFDMDQAIADELRTNWDEFSAAGQNTLWINGVQLEQSQINAFALLEHLRRERKYISSLTELGLSSNEAIQLLSHQILADSKQAEMPQRFDFRDTAEGGGIIVWLNDLEKDKRYREWSASVSVVRRFYKSSYDTIASLFTKFHLFHSLCAVSTPVNSTR